MTLWKYNKITGFWVSMRNVTPETQREWLNIFMKDEPNETFKVSKYKPKN